MHRKLKILQVVPELNAGGVEKGTLELARFLVKMNHESVVISNGGRMQKKLEEEGSKHIKLPIHRKHIFSFAYIFVLRNLLLRESFDIVHLRSRMPAWLFYIAWKMLPTNKKPKLITTFHGFYSVNSYSGIMAKGQGIICVSNSVKKYVLENYSISKNKPLTVIHRGADPNYFIYNYKAPESWLSHWNKEFESLKEKFIITLPGRLTKWKGHEDLLQIIYHLKKDGIPIHALLIGNVNRRKLNYYERLKRNVYKLNLEDDVTILKHRDDLREIMSVSDLVISCSTDPEAFGRVSLEALTLGVPVIAYAHGGVKEQLNELFPFGEIEPNKKSSMRLKIKEFYTINEKPKPIKNTRFTLEKTNQNILRFYQKMIEQS